MKCLRLFLIALQVLSVTSFWLLGIAPTSARTLDLGPLGKGELVGRATQWAQDPTRSWTVEQAANATSRFHPSLTDQIGYGGDQSVYWVRLDWRRPTGDLRSLFLVEWPSHGDKIDLWFLTSRGWTVAPYRWGDNQTWDSRLPRHRFSTVPFPSENQGSLLVRLESTNPFLFEPRVYDLNSLSMTDAWNYSMMGFLVGYIVLIALMSLLRFLTSNDRLSLLYFFYILALLAYLLVYSGTWQSLFPELKPFQNAWDVPLENLAVLTACLFAYHANGFDAWRPAAWGGVLLMVLVLVSMSFHWMGDHRLALQIANVLVLLTAVFVEGGALVQALRGRRLSRFFLGGWTSLLLAAGLIATLAGFAPTLVQQDVSIDISTASLILLASVVVEVTILSISLVDRVNQAQKDLNRRIEQAARDERLSTLGLLTAQVGHEVNSANHVIALNAALLERSLQNLKTQTLAAMDDGLDAQEVVRSLSGQSTLLVQSIHQASRQIGSVVAGLRTLVRARNPATLVDLNMLILATIQIYAIRWNTMSDRLVFHPSGNRGTIVGEESRLQQLIVNLVANALESLPERGRAVEISTENRGGEIVMTIADQGRGMDKETLSLLGTPFFTGREAQGGTGLGWRLCQEIIREHRGSYTIESTPGRGTTVTVVFPRSIEAVNKS